MRGQIDLGKKVEAAMRRKSKQFRPNDKNKQRKREMKGKEKKGKEDRQPAVSCLPHA